MPTTMCISPAIEQHKLPNLVCTLLFPVLSPVLPRRRQAKWEEFIAKLS